eukprot:6829482-Prymnesium_polylepis.1
MRRRCTRRTATALRAGWSRVWRRWSRSRGAPRSGQRSDHRRGARGTDGQKVAAKGRQQRHPA